MRKIVIDVGKKKSQKNKVLTFKSKKLLELDEIFITATSLLNMMGITDKELKFEKDKFDINYLSPLYVEMLRNFIIEMYKDSEDPIIQGYTSKSNLFFIMDYVKNIGNNYKIKRWSIIKKAAYLFYNINLKHPFTDGNKRTALITCNSFLEYNGYTIGPLPYRASYKFIKEVAKGQKTLEECYSFINKQVCTFEITKKAKKQTLKYMNMMKEDFKKEKNNLIV